MKKPVIISIILIITLFQNIIIVDGENEENKIFINYSFEEPKITSINIEGNCFNKIILDSCSNSGNPGEPNIPKKGANILLPANSKVKNIIANYEDIIFLGSNYVIAPVEKLIPSSEITNKKITNKNNTIYNSNNLFPGTLFSEIGIYSFRGYNILILELHPIQYIPKTGELFYYKGLTISVELEKEDNNNLFRGLDRDSTKAALKVDNPIVINQYYNMNSLNKNIVKSQEKYELLILTTERFKDGFEVLKNYHDSNGIKTLIKTIDEIQNCNTSKIRELIKETYLNNEIEYVLIGGDSDIIPAQRIYVGTPIQPSPYGDFYAPSDMFYACLDGCFNYDGDEYWGEKNDGENGNDVDLIADVYVGRACVSEEVDVNNFISKTITYLETNNNDPYLYKFLVTGEYLTDTLTSHIFGMDIIKDIIDYGTGCNNFNYFTRGIPSDLYVIDTLFDKNWPGFDFNYPKSTGWSKEDIANKINSGFHMINHLGHSDKDYNLKLKIDDLKYFNNQDNLCFIYSQGCRAGLFDYNKSDCIAEYFTVKRPYGAFAGIWNAELGWIGNNGGDGPSQCYHREFIDAIFGEGIRSISEANQDSKEDNIWRINNKYMRWCYYQLNLFGDPTICLKLEQTNNNPPEIPTITGSPTGKIGQNYEFTVCSNDIDGDKIYYYIDWDEGSEFPDGNLYGPYAPDTPASISRTFVNEGMQIIKARAKDCRGGQSQWSEPFLVNISKSKTAKIFINSALQKFGSLDLFERLFFQILNIL